LLFLHGSYCHSCSSVSPLHLIPQKQNTLTQVFPPRTTTITSTVTITEPPPVTYKRGLDARQVTVSPTAVPTYATYCPNASAYSSACSCVGITAYITTAPTPVVTAYATATTTVYSNPYECDNPQICAANSACGGGCGYCHPDTKTGKGYCVNRGSCPSENDCNKDEDCKAGGVCLNTCCGKTCDYAADNFCSANSPKMLFRKATNDQNPPPS
jgi:hypothetical protein